VLCFDVERSGRRQKYECSVPQSLRNPRRNYVQTYGPQASLVQEICLRYVPIYSLTSNHVATTKTCLAQYVHPIRTSSQPWCPVATLYSLTIECYISEKIFEVFVSEHNIQNSLKNLEDFTFRTYLVLLSENRHAYSGNIEVEHCSSDIRPTWQNNNLALCFTLTRYRQFITYA